MWSMREDFVAIVVGQLPLISPMFKRKFWVDAGYASDKTRNTYDRYNSSRSPGYELGSGIHIQSGRRKTHDPYSLTHIGVSRVGSESEEDIVRTEDKAAVMNQYSPSKRNTGIMVQHTIDIERSSERSVDNLNDPRKKGWFSVV